MGKVKLSQEGMQYTNSIKRRAGRVYLVMALFALIILDVIITFYDNKASAELIPDLNRAEQQIEHLLPILKDNEEKLRDVYENIQEIYTYQMDQFKQFETTDEAIEDIENDKGIISDFNKKELEDLISDTLSWHEQVSRIKVGRDGCVKVLTKDGVIISSPDSADLGVRINLDSIDLIKELPTYVPYMDDDNMEKIGNSVLSYFDSCTIGRIKEYDDCYVLIGASLLEMLNTAFQPAIFVFLITLVTLWLLAKYFILCVYRHDKNNLYLTKKFRFASIIAIVFVFAVSFYYQTLIGVTGQLKTMESHAQVAVDTMDEFEEETVKIEKWLEEQYSTQTSLYASVIGELEKLPSHAEVVDMTMKLDAVYIFIFDTKGNVVITSSPYDHIKVSDDEEHWTYAFKPLVEGALAWKGEITKEPNTGTELQYYGSKIMDQDGLSEGFVVIGFATNVRKEITEPLSVDSVLENTTIGLPKYALAIDKETNIITNSTLEDLKGVDIEDLGLSKDNLTDKFSGFLNINGEEFYAGVRETQSHYFVPIVPKNGSIAPLSLAFRLALFMCICAVIMSKVAMHKYQENVVEADPDYNREPIDPEEELNEASSEEFNAEEAMLEEQGILKQFSKYMKSRDNEWGFAERWNMSSVPKEEWTPEHRILRIIDIVLLILAIISIIPVITLDFSGNTVLQDFTGLLYITSGKWERGFNIFAFSGCFYLICVLYVLVKFMNRVLYQISKYTNARVETVCLLLRTSLKYVCVIVFIYFGLSYFGVDTKTLLASAGILSMVIGFGAKELITDVLAGIFMIFEGTIKVGDFITVGDFWGTVQQIGIRTTRVEWFGDVKIYNNSQLSNIVNCRGEITRRTIKVPISYDEDLEYVEGVLKEELPTITDKLYGATSPVAYQGVAGYDDHGILLRFVVYAKSTLRMVVERCFLREIKLIFDKHGIEMPYIQYTVHFANPPKKRPKGEDLEEDHEDALDGDAVDQESFNDLSDSDDHESTRK